MFRTEKGFTLIELLIVIVIIGTLFVGLFTAIDPLEQTRKSGDTALKGIISQFHQSLTSYSATQGQYPWATDTVAAQLSATSFSSTSVSNPGYLKMLEDTGNLNKTFRTRSEEFAERIYVNSPAPGDEAGSSVIICFKPASKAIRGENNTKYTQTGESCTPNTTNTNCFWCLK